MNKTYYKSIDETVYHELLSNGLNVYIIKKEGFVSKSAFFATKFGSFNTGDLIISDGVEHVLPGGLAHFLEHRVFDYHKGNIMDLYYKLGADVNAYTSYDRTVYYFSTVDNFYPCLELLLDFPTSFTMSKEAVENEKDIIVNELLMYKDDPTDKLFKGLMNALYKEHPIRFDVGGEPDEVRGTTWELLKIAHQNFYNPQNMHLVIVGDVDVEETLKIVKEKKFQTKSCIYTKKEISEPIETIDNNVKINADVNNEKLLIGYKFKPIDNLSTLEKTKVFLIYDILCSVLFSSSTEFYKRMIDEKNISFLTTDILQYPSMFLFVLEADILKEPECIVAKINEQFDNALSLLNEDRLNIIKKKEIASLIKGSDSISSLGRNFISCILDDMNYCTLIDIIKSISIQDIENAYNQYYKNSYFSYAHLKGKEND